MSSTASPPWYPRADDWRPPRRWHGEHRPSSTLWRWLTDPRSLTERLRRRCPGGLRVQVLAQHWQRPLRDEALLLGIGLRRWALVRHVALCCGDTRWVAARTVIPAQALAGANRRLAHLGARPLGPLIFGDPRWRRSRVDIAPVAAGHPRFFGVDGDTWGRRSLFHLQQRPLLVYEVFLSAFVERELGTGMRAPVPEPHLPAALSA